MRCTRHIASRSSSTTVEVTSSKRNKISDTIRPTKRLRHGQYRLPAAKTHVRIVELSVSELNLQVDYLQSYIQVIGLYGRGPGLAPPRSRASIATLAATCRGIVATPPVLCSQREGQEVKSGLH